ncbi:MAG: hypothetical protein KDB53_16990, partial [Planctomycetes bacterium]|nr:hypothetical protein [Planctomycetota bacterium]
PFFVMLGENLVDGERLQLIGRVFGYHFADITETIKFSNHGLYLVFIAACLVFPRRIWRSDAGLPALVAWGGVAAYFLVYVVSFEDLLWHLYTSSPRVLLHLLPVMVLTCAHLAGRLRPGGNAEKRSVTNDVQPTSLPENPSDRTSDPNARPAEDLPRQEGGPEAT